VLLWRSPPPRLLQAGALVAAALLVVTPWIARNHHVFGKVLYTTNEATTLAGANCQPSYYGDVIGGFTITCLSLTKLPADANPAEIASERREEAFRYVARHKGRAVVVAGLRVLRLWGLYGIDSQTKVAGRGRTVQTAGLVFFYGLVALAVAGVASMYAARRRRELAVMLAPILVATLTAALTYGLPRLRHIADIALLVLAGVAITAVAQARSPATGRGTPRGARPAAPRA
jgi:hypothetical protein